MSMEPTDTPSSPDASARQADTRDRADMERLAAGHDAALNDLMERHATPVFHFLCRMVGNEDDANDLAQETFGRDDNALTLFDDAGEHSMARAPKPVVARALLDHVATLIGR